MRRHQETIEILEIMMALPSGITWSYQLHKMTGYRTGTIVPILNRLFDAGVLESRMSRISGTAPPRRLYWLSPEGEERVKRWIEHGGEL